MTMKQRGVQRNLSAGALTKKAGSLALEREENKGRDAKRQSKIVQSAGALTPSSPLAQTHTKIVLYILGFQVTKTRKD